jgi:UDP-3-O-[3-hydroxymyristoyl] glucosamine N-acyltransferase
MKLSRAYRLSEIAQLLNAQFFGDKDILVTGINEIHVVESGDIAFVDHPKYYQKTLSSAVAVVIINQPIDCPPGKGLIVCQDPFSAFNKLIRHFSPNQIAQQRIASSAKIGIGTEIHPTASIGENVTIGSNCIVLAGVSVGNNCQVGDRVIIHPNSVLGGDAFYYKRRESGYDKLLSCGNVVIENDVEIGAGCTIDRGVSGTTRIGEGTKLDNLVHIAHDTAIGKRCLFAAQVGIAGCVTIDDDVTFWGQVGCIANVTIGKGVTVLAQSGVANSLEEGKTYFGSPAKEARQKMRELAAVSRLAK